MTSYDISPDSVPPTGVGLQDTSDNHPETARKLTISKHVEDLKKKLDNDGISPSQDGVSQQIINSLTSAGIIGRGDLLHALEVIDQRSVTRNNPLTPMGGE